MEDNIKNNPDHVTKTGAEPGQRTITRPAEARIPLLDVSELSEDQRMLVAIGTPNIFRMLAHSPDMLTAWLDFSVRLTTGGRVPMRTRELLILQVALRTSCEYAWANHVPAALSVGISASEIASLTQGTGSWSAAEAAVLGLVDDLCADNCASEKTWQELTATYDEGEIIELLLLIGFYRMNAGFLNSLGVPAEPGRPRLGQGMPSYEAPIPTRRPASIATTETHSEVKPDGSWHLKFYQPGGTQELRLVIETREGELSGSLISDAAGITMPISDGKAHGRQVIFTTVMTKPYPITIAWDGTIDGDILAGTAKINDAGAFPFDGTRI